VIRLPRSANAGIPYKQVARDDVIMTPRAKIYWTLGNVLMFVGIVVLLYVGGVYANEEYGRYAARGDTDAPAPAVVVEPERRVEPAPFIAPRLNVHSPAARVEGAVTSPLPEQVQADQRSLVSRVIIPSIGVDSKVVEVGWDIEEQNGRQVAVWQVAKFAVGQHKGSANPGEGNNVVLAGHVGGYGKVFKDLYYVNPGDQITIYSDSQQFLYTVTERLLVTEEGVSPEQQAANAQLIAPTDTETVTLVTCWPPDGAEKFTQRVVVHAVPFTTGASSDHATSSWSIR
jgi:LPXTG-site transpeptidase (sortase) family protein